GAAQVVEQCVVGTARIFERVGQNSNPVEIKGPRGEQSLVVDRPGDAWDGPVLPVEPERIDHSPSEEIAEQVAQQRALLSPFFTPGGEHVPLRAKDSLEDPGYPPISCLVRLLRFHCHRGFPRSFRRRGPCCRSRCCPWRPEIYCILSRLL